MAKKYCCSLAKIIDPQLFQALSDPNRLQIVGILADCKNMSQTVSEIAENFVTDISGVSRHLSILRDADILTSNRQGQQVLYTLNADILANKLRKLADALSTSRKTSRK